MLQICHDKVSETRNSKSKETVCDAITDQSVSALQSVRDAFGSCWKKVLGVDKKLKTSVFDDDWFKYILQLNYFEIVGLASVNEEENHSALRLSRVPMSFQSPRQYLSIFQPLILEEFKAQLHSSFWDMAFPWETMYHGNLSVLNLDRTGIFHLVSFVHYDDDQFKQFKNLFKNDLVLLTQQPPRNDSGNDVHVIGKVEEFERHNDKKMSIVQIRLCFCKRNSRLSNAKDVMQLKPDVQWHASRITSITPQLREFLALSSLPNFHCSIRSVILKRYYHGCNNLEHEVAFRELSQPLQKIIKPSFNDCQLQAIGASIGLHNSKGFQLSLIQGPPGTGKTQTIIGIVSCLLATSQGHVESSENEALDEKPNEDERSSLRGRVLICAQSNAAIDEVVSRISRAGLYGNDGEMYMPYIVRAGKAETTHPNSMPFFLDTLADHCLAQEMMNLGFGNKNGAVIDYITLHQNLNKLLKKFSKFKVQRTKTTSKEMSNANSMMRILKDISAAQAQDTRVDNIVTSLKHILRKAILRQAEIVLTTLNGCGGDVYRFCYVPHMLDHKLSHELSKDFRFDAVVIDEAAQALEPATLIPLQLLKRNGPKCIMVGDPKQLPATVLSKVASKFLYGRSMFERLQRAGHPVTMLTKQYRMHPEISRFPSLRFYYGKLQNGENMSAKAASFHESNGLGPYLFFDVIDGKEVRGSTSGGFSLSNEQEAQAAVEQLMFFKKRFPCEFMSQRFGIITPYKSQLCHMRACFSRAFEPSVLANMEFHTVDGFQGREVDIVILSTVRAAESCTRSSIGFVADVRRMNVALTRAKLSLWIFGNSRTLQINHNWSALVRDAARRNLVILIKTPCAISRMTDADFENLIKNGKNVDTIDLRSNRNSSKSESSIEHVPVKRPLPWTSSNRISSCPSKRRRVYHGRVKHYECNARRPYGRS